MRNNDIKIKASDNTDISDYITDFEEGNLQVPLFQRDFVWETDQKLELFRSMAKGYPIGSILLWKPNKETLEVFESIDNKLTVGSYYVPTKNNESFYILDGFQRLSTLLGSLIDPSKAKSKGISRNEEAWYREFNFVYNLKSEDFEVVKVKDLSKLKWYQIPIYELVDAKNFYKFQVALSNKNSENSDLFNENRIDVNLYLERYEHIGNKLIKYKVPNITLYGGSISEAIEIFQKLNSQGSKITMDWVISAILINNDPNFRLGSEITSLIDNDLKSYQFHTIKREVIFNCILNSFGVVYFDNLSQKDVKNLIESKNFIKIAKKTFEAIKNAAKFMHEELMVLDAKLIPYNNQFIFIADFFNQIKEPSKNQIAQLKKWFWITTYSNYFTIYNLSKQRTAYKKFQKFILDENTDPVFYDNDSSFMALSFPDKITMGSVRGKALALFMINYSANNTINLTVNSTNSDVILDYKTSKIDGTKDNMIPENTIFQILYKSNTVEIFLDKENENLFFSNDMIEKRSKGKIDEMLSLRKILISKKEKDFILNDLKIGYEEEYSPL
jgi:hypothetical protein